MIELCNRKYSDVDLRRYFGDAAPVVGIRRYTLSEGRAHGCEIVEMTTGSGLVYEVNVSRGMDLGRCSFRGTPIAYQSYAREVHPAYCEPFNDEWLRSYAGGMLVTCGLSSMGSPQHDRGEDLPLHGRISYVPAENISVSDESGDSNLLKVTGRMRESKALNYNLTLTRSVSSVVGTSTIIIDDVVENRGFESQELMILYHFNIGHPIVDEGAKLLSRSSSVVPRDDDAAKQGEPFRTYLAPTPHYKDIVYYHRPNADDSGMCHIGLLNEKVGLGVGLQFKRDELDCLTQWKFLSEGNYVAGIEPGNAFVSGRSVERSKGRIKTIEPQEKRHFRLELEVLTSMSQIEALKREIGAD